MKIALLIFPGILGLFIIDPSKHEPYIQKLVLVYGFIYAVILLSPIYIPFYIYFIGPLWHLYIAIKSMRKFELSFGTSNNSAVKQGSASDNAEEHKLQCIQCNNIMHFNSSDIEKTNEIVPQFYYQCEHCSNKDQSIYARCSLLVVNGHR